MKKKTPKQLIIEAITDSVPDISVKQAENIYESSRKAGELARYDSAEQWLTERFLPNVVILNRDDYVLALTQALRVAPKLAGTDFSTTRQRDLGQVWTDTARGFLGEIAFARLLNKKLGLTLKMDYTLGAVKDYLSSDIKSIHDAEGNIYKLGLNISIKTTKFKGGWLDVTGKQIEHSDVFFLIKLGIEREHFVSFLKDISFVRDKLLSEALQIGAISQGEADELWESLPEFQNIPCYISGFIDKESIATHKDVDPTYKELLNRAKQGKGIYEISEYIGWVYKNIAEGIPEEINKNCKFVLIENFTTSGDRFVANIGLLKNSVIDWQRFTFEAFIKET